MSNEAYLKNEIERLKIKIQKLEEVKKKLKEDFVGIDSVIDRVISSISPWYLTPEVIERPLVVSLWGLTGTGKTSLVRKLVEYLNLSERLVYFDCGEHDKDSGSTITDIIDQQFGEEDFLGGPVKDIIFVFDHGRIIEQGSHQELLKQKGRYHQLFMLQYQKNLKLSCQLSALLFQNLLLGEGLIKFQVIRSCSFSSFCCLLSLLNLRIF